MELKKRRLRRSNLYLILDKGSLKVNEPVKTALKTIKAGVDILQIRDKFSSDKEMLEYGKQLKKISGRYKIPLIINDRIDICEILNADGVHLGQDDIPLKKARLLLGRKKIIGISCHSLPEAIKAEKEGADYIAIGPIFKSPTKPGLKPRGISLLKDAKKKIKIPIVAIGGINAGNVEEVIINGADIIAVASAILKKKDVKKATQELTKIIKTQHDAIRIR